MIAQALLASTAIVLLSFISEDAATISSALSLFGGPITWPLGFAACFVGIWVGDLGLYSLARCFGVRDRSYESGERACAFFTRHALA